MASPRKSWTPKEQDAFIAQYKLCRQAKMGKFNSRFQAQIEAIPVAKRYTELSLKQSQTLAGALKDALNEIDDVLSGKIQEPVEIVTAVAPFQPVPEPAKERSLEDIIGELATKLRQDISRDNDAKIKAAVDANFQAVLDYFTDPAMVADGATTIEEVRRRKRIVIVGLLEKQFQIIKREFPKMRLINIESHETGSKLQAACIHSEVTLIMTDWVSHSIEDIVRKHSPQWVRVPGTMTALRTQLKDLV